MPKRLGLIVPSSNSVMEVDFFRNLPSECSLHTARMHLRDTTVAGEERMLDQFLPQAIRDLATVRPRVVVFGCTSAGALRGNSYDQNLCTEIGLQTGAAVVSVIAASRQALSSTGATRVGVITPYVEELNERIRLSLQADGLQVAVLAGLDISDNFEIASVEPQTIARFCRDRLLHRDVEAVFVSCTNFRSLEVQDTVSRDLGIPVVTSNQAALDAARLLM